MGRLPINGENRLLLTNEPSEFEKLTIEVQNLRKYTDRFLRINKTYLNLELKEVNI